MRVLALLVAIGVAAGCGKAAVETQEKLIEAAASADGKKVDVDLNTSGGAMTVKSEDGSGTFSFGGGAQLPSDWPKDVPVIKGLSLQAAITQNEGQMEQITGTTSENLESVASFYQAELGKQGWVEQSSMTQAGMQNKTYKKDSRMLHFAVMGQPGSTTVVLSITTEP